MRRLRAHGVVLPAVLACLLAGCQSAERNVARDQGAAASGEGADTGATSPTTGAPAATPRGGLTDSNIVAILDAANRADSAAGALALKKAASAEVKGFAKLMVSEHHMMRVEGQSLAKKLGVAPKPPEKDPLAPYVASEMKALQSAPRGAAFDRVYIDNEVTLHQAVLDFANQARVTTQTPELRALIEKAIPIVRKHLEQAMALQKQLTPAA